MKTLLVALTSTAIYCSSMLVYSMPEQQPQADQSFELYDIDRNGTISTHEAVRDENLQSVFKLIDTDGNEQLSKEEYQHYMGINEKKPG